MSSLQIFERKHSKQIAANHQKIPGVRVQVRLISKRLSFMEYFPENNTQTDENRKQ
jgi:hypothetical protein